MSLQAAVPRYVGPEFNDAPSGHRFKLYNVSTREITITRAGARIIVREAKAHFESLSSKTRQEKAKSGQLKADIRVRLGSDKRELLEILPPRP